MTALEEVVTLAQNYVVSSIEIMGTQSGAFIRLHQGDDKEPIVGHGISVEEAAESALDCWRRKMRPKTGAPAVIEQRPA